MSLKIGIAGPKTGPCAALGAQIYTGARAAVKAINAAGGVNGALIEVKEYDDGGDPKQSVAVANRVINDEVVAVIGHCLSSCSQPATDIYEDEGVIAITPASTSPDITARGYKLIFRTSGLDSYRAAVAGDFIINNLKGKKVAVVHDKDQYGEGLASAVMVYLRTHSSEPVLFEGINQGDKDFQALVKSLKANDVDVVFFGGLYPEAGLLVRQLREAGLKAKFVSGDGIDTDGFQQVAQSSAEGVYMISNINHSVSTYAAFVVKELEAEGASTEGYTLHAYAAVQAVAAAFRAVGSNTEKEKAASWLHSSHIETVIGSLTWDDKGDLKYSKSAAYELHFGKPSTEVSN